MTADVSLLYFSEWKKCKKYDAEDPTSVQLQNGIAIPPMLPKICAKQLDEKKEYVAGSEQGELRVPLLDNREERGKKGSGFVSRRRRTGFPRSCAERSAHRGEVEGSSGRNKYNTTNR